MIGQILDFWLKICGEGVRLGVWDLNGLICYGILKKNLGRLVGNSRNSVPNLGFFKLRVYEEGVKVGIGTRIVWYMVGVET